MTVRVGLTGLGMMGTAHFKGYKEIAAAEVVALCDVQAQRLAGDFTGTAGNIDTGSAEREDVSSMATYESFDDLVADENVDMIDICLPTFLHEDMTRKALAAGKHVFCEKPMALTFEQACGMREAADKAGKMLMIGQCLRFWPEYVMIKEMIESGVYGKPRSAVLRRLGAAPNWSWDSWLLENDRSGGVALDLHIHDVDTVNWFFGKPASVYSQGTTRGEGAIGHIFTQFAYDDGPVVLADGSWEAQGEFPFTMSVMIDFESASVDYSLGNSPTIKVYKADGTTETPEVPPGDAYRDELAYFVACIEDGTPPTRMPNESAALAVKIVQAELESVRTGRPVRIEA